MSEWIVDDTYLGSLSTNNVKPDALIVLGMQDPELEAGDTWERSPWPVEAL